MEKMTEKEIAMLKALQAKQKRVKRSEAVFFEEVQQRKKEILHYWGFEETDLKRIKRLSDIAHQLNASEDKVLDDLEQYVIRRSQNYNNSQ